jgi:hypothetical protein
VERQKYGMPLEQLTPRGIAAAEAAELNRARTIIYRDETPIAAIVPFEDLEVLDPSDPAEAGPDPLLSLCGSCRQDQFVDSVIGNLNRTMLFSRG